MSTLKELLKDVPVEWKALGEVTGILRGRRLTKKQLSEEGYPVYHGGLEPLGYYTDFNRPAKSVMIINVGASAGNVGFSSYDFWSSDGCYCIEKIDKIYSKFLFYFLLSKESFLKSKVRYAGIPTLDANIIGNIKIPIPYPNDPEKSLAIQQEIVRVLDGLSEQNKALTAALTNEIDNRKKQYEYYREELFRFEGKEVEWKTLGEVAEYSKKRCNISKLNEYNYVGVDNLLQNRVGKSKSKYLPTDGNFTEYLVNDILIGNIRPYLKKIWLATCDGGTSGDILVIKNLSSQIKSKYLYQILADDSFFKYNMIYAKGVKMPRGDKKKIMDYTFPIPYPNDNEKSIQEQERIVRLLDKYDEATKNIVAQLEKEIDLRNKQYEYYRNQLLTFSK